MSLTIDPHKADPPPFEAAKEADRRENLRKGRAVLSLAILATGGRSGMAALHNIADGAVLVMRSLAGRLARGTTTIAGWFTASLRTITIRHYAGTLALAGKGTTPPPAALADIDARINRQAGFLARLKQVVSEKTITAPAFVARAGSYGQAVWSTAQNVARKFSLLPPTTPTVPFVPSGYERRILDLAADHCGVCPAEARKGWRPPGTLREIGDSPCRGRCRCSFAIAR